MRLQKTYIGFCIATWTLWCVTLLLCLISGNAWDVRIETLYSFAKSLSSISFTISLIPMHPILFVLSIISSVKQKREDYTAFNIFSIILTTILAIFILGNHVLMVGGA